MEPASSFDLKLRSFKSALDDFENSFNIEISKYSPQEIDLFKNGQIQKFEFTIEPAWKTIKYYLSEKHLIEAVSPKSSIKEFFHVSLIDEKEFEKLQNMLEDRNRLSQIYSEMFMNEIHAKLKDYLSTLKNVYTILSN